MHIKKLTESMCTDGFTFFIKSLVELIWLLEFYVKCFKLKVQFCQVVVVYTFNPSTWEAEAGGSLSLRLAWSIRAGSRTGSKATQRNPVSKNQKHKTKQKQQKVQFYDKYSTTHISYVFPGVTWLFVFSKEIAYFHVNLQIYWSKFVCVYCEYLWNLWVVSQPLYLQHSRISTVSQS